MPGKKTHLRKNRSMATVSEEKAFELKQMRVEEVSAVDLPANEQPFLVAKSDTTNGETIDLTETPKTEVLTDEMAALDKKDAEEAAKARAAADAELVAKDAADAKTETVKAEESAPVVEPKTEETPKEELAVETAKAADLSEAAAVPGIIASRAQAAWLAGIDSIEERLQILREAVKTAAPDPVNGSVGHAYPVWEHVQYLHKMLDALCCIGGPEWDINAAAVSGATAKADANISKVGRAISAPRLAALKDIYNKCGDISKVLESLLSEVDGEEQEKKVETAKAEPTATTAESVQEAPKQTVAVENTPVVSAAPSAELETLKQAIEALQKEGALRAQEVDGLRKTVAAQSEQLAKARTNVRSNVQTDEQPEKRVKVDTGWFRDMASSEAKIKR